MASTSLSQHLQPIEALRSTEIFLKALLRNAFKNISGLQVSAKRCING